jgi:hypothetical protein
MGSAGCSYGILVRKIVEKEELGRKNRLRIVFSGGTASGVRGVKPSTK